MKSFEEIAAEEGASIIDPQSFFCREGTCRTRRDDMVLYLNGSQISVEASRALIPDFVRAIERVG